MKFTTNIIKKRGLCLILLLLSAGPPLLAQLNQTFYGSTADAEVSVDTVGQTFPIDGGSGVLDPEKTQIDSGNGAVRINRGRYNPTPIPAPPGYNAFAANKSAVSFVAVWKLPWLGLVANPFTAATVKVYITKPTGYEAAIYNGPSIDLYGLGRRNTDEVKLSDFYVGTSGGDTTDATLIQASVIASGAAVAEGQEVSVNSTALLAYLNSQYDSGNGAGRYIFLRFNSTATNTTQAVIGLHLFSANNANTDKDPALVVTLANPIPPATLYVDKSGPSDGTGYVIGQPLKSIAKALELAQPGDTINIRAGVYEETLNPPSALSGTAANPTIIQAYSPTGDSAQREAVELTSLRTIVPGQAGVGFWEAYSAPAAWGLTGLYRIKIPAVDNNSTGVRNLLKAGVLKERVALGGVQLQNARWPNTPTIPDLTRDHVARSTAGTLAAGATPDDKLANDAAAYTVTGLDVFPDDSLIDATLRFSPGFQWSILEGKVAGNSGTSLGFTFNFTEDAYKPRERDWLIVWNSLATLDDPTEFYIDFNSPVNGDGTRWLYVKSASGNAPSQSLAIGGDTVATFSGDQYIQLRGITVSGGGINIDGTSGNLLLEELTVRDTQNSSGIRVNGDEITLRDIDVYNIERGAGINITKTAQNVSVENVVSRNTSDAGILTALGASHVTVKSTTIYNTGGHGLSYPSFNSDYGYVHVYRGGRITSDVGLINAFVGEVPSDVTNGPLNTRVHHNWVHSPQAERTETILRWQGMIGIRTDSGSTKLNSGVSGVTIDHNLIWGEGLNRGVSVWALRDWQAGYGNSQIKVFNNTITVGGTDGGSIIVTSYNNTSEFAVGYTANSWNATGHEIFNNVAAGYDVYDVIANAAGKKPTRVEGNIFTNYNSTFNLPADNDSRVGKTKNLAVTDPVLRQAVNRVFTPSTGSPVINRAVTDATYTDADVGAIQSGAAPWLAGALVQPRHVANLKLRGVRDAAGSSWAVVENLPAGRLLPLATTVTVGGTTLSGGLWRYDSDKHAGSLWFSLSSLSLIANASTATLDLDGAASGQAPRALSAATTGFDSPTITDIVWDLPNKKVTVKGSGFYGSPTALKPVDLQTPVGGDLRERPVYYDLATDGATSPRFDLLALTGGELVPLNRSQDRFAGGRASGWAVLPDAVGAIFGPAASFQIYSTARTGGGPRDHSAPSRPGAGSDGPPEQVMWATLDPAEGYLKHRFQPERALTNSVPSAANDLVDTVSGGGTTSQATSSGTKRPTWLPNSLNGLPALRFDGTDQLDYTALAPDTWVNSGAFRVFAIFRNVDNAGDTPAGANSQRLVITGNANRSLLRVETDGSSKPLPKATPTLLNNTYSSASNLARNPIRIGHDEKADDTGFNFNGWLGEVILLENPTTAYADRSVDNLKDYYATKYRLQPVGRLLDATSPTPVAAVAATYSGLTLTPVSVTPTEIVFGFTEAVVTPGQDFNLTLTGGGSATFKIWTPLQTWRVSQGLAVDASNTADPDGDGLANLLEYALDREPLIAESTAPTTATVDGSGKLQITFKRARPATELTYTVQASSDLVTWTDLAINPGTVGQNVTVSDIPPAGAPRRFLRLRVTLP
jgi:hypothetical protein